MAKGWKRVCGQCGVRKPQDNIGDGNLTPLSGGQRICSLPHQKKGGTAYGSDRVCTEPPWRTAYAVVDSDVPDDIETIDLDAADNLGYSLIVKTADGNSYFVCMTSYHFIETIHHGNPEDGELVYHAIE